MTAQQQRPPSKPQTRGPVLFVIFLAMGLCSVALTAWFVGVAIELGGGLFWPQLGQQHAARLVEQDLGYIAAAPRSLLIEDTVAFSHRVADTVGWPYRALSRLRWCDTPNAGQSAPRRGMGAAKDALCRMASSGAAIATLIAQDVLLRLSVALFALPAFALACLLGVLDGMVRRDLRRWSGGRESSFVYHHAKHTTVWALTGGFGLYLSWPFGGINPAYMVLIFTALVAATLSTTVGAFKKYL